MLIILHAFVFTIYNLQHNIDHEVYFEVFIIW